MMATVYEITYDGGEYICSVAMIGHYWIVTFEDSYRVMWVYTIDIPIGAIREDLESMYGEIEVHDRD